MSATTRTPAARRDEWADAVFTAVGFLRSQITDLDSPHRFAAATELLNLEVTRMRHGRRVSGTEWVGDHPAEEPREDEFELTPEEVRELLVAECERRGMADRLPPDLRRLSAPAA